jgi:hypothetical protein
MINEELAKRAWNQNHLINEYKENQATKEWDQRVAEATEIIIKNELMTDEEKNFAIEKYKRKTAEWINKRNSNDANHVAWFVSGPANYNTRKHEKWLNREDTLMREYDYIFNVDNYIKKPKLRNEIKQDIEEKEYEYNGITVIQNIELNRLQLIFEGKPSDEVREILKSNGFKWSPKNTAWQRQLTQNALYTFNRIKDKLI